MKFVIVAGAAMLGASAGYVATLTRYTALTTVLGSMLLFAAIADMATRGLEDDSDDIEY